jgi:hypothetical protein
MQYQLNGTIDQAGVEQNVANGHSIMVVRSAIISLVSSDNLPIAWLTWSPFESNSMTWQEIYRKPCATTLRTDAPIASISA